MHALLGVWKTIDTMGFALHWWLIIDVKIK